MCQVVEKNRKKMRGTKGIYDRPLPLFYKKSAATITVDIYQIY